MTSETKAATLTGATGFLGSHIMVKLLQNGYSLKIAGRQRTGKSLQERIQNLLNWFNCENLQHQITFYETDFRLPRLGLNDRDYRNLCADSSPFIHCASDTSFAEKNRDRVMETNVNSLKYILEFIRDGRTNGFHYISTAYSAGLVQGTIGENPVSAVEFTNVYEESKAIAEREISFYCNKFSIPFSIIRPSIVYGDSDTGRALKFNALYYPVKSIQYIRDIYINDIKNNNGAKSRQYGIYIDNKGFLHLPIIIHLPNDGKINLIPVNYFTHSVLKIIETKPSGDIYHITSDTPSDIKTLLKYIEDFLLVKGLEADFSMTDNSTTRNPPEELFDHFIKPYLPYLSDRRLFERKNIQKISGGPPPPEISYKIFKVCMDYAVSVEWGKHFNDF